MTKRDILSISFKILGVISVMYTVISIPAIGMAISMVFQQPRQDFNPYWFLGVTIVSPILVLTMAYVLLRWGDLIAEKLVRDDSVAPTLGASQWERPVFIVSLRIVGVVCLIRGIPELVKVLANLAFRGRYQGIISPHTWSSIIGAIVLLIIGGYLISGGKHLVEFTFRERKTTPSSHNIS